MFIKYDFIQALCAMNTILLRFGVLFLFTVDCPNCEESIYCIRQGTALQILAAYCDHSVQNRQTQPQLEQLSDSSDTGSSHALL